MEALLLVDIQNDYFDNGKMPVIGSDIACENARQLLGHFREKGMPVVHVMHVSNRESATFFLPYSTGAEIADPIKPLPHEKVIIKNVPNSFFATDLLAYLMALQVSDLVIGGMMTHMCIDATVRAAKDLGFNCTLIGDACATIDLELDGKKVDAKNVQLCFLAALNNVYASVLTTKQFLEIKK